MFLTLLKREFHLFYKKKAELAQLLVFLLLSMLILPLSISPDPALLASISAGYIWIVQLFMIFLSLKLFYAEDHRDGSLDQLFLKAPLPYLVIAKYIAYSLSMITILLISLPFSGILLRLDAGNLLKIAASLIIGIPCLTVIGGFGAALILGSKKAGVLLPILLIPLYIPVLIFAVGGADFPANLWILGAFLLFVAPLSVFFSALALKIAIKE